ncbi:hypothetical protein NDU88_002529 [Pleurodeles waltl]|uniref:Uncharacterized protein n=1 Tax=Pleurodeles waltl TaxID=8319 RepID=A0AAV7MMZ1_PLEWA|nr:hypothetical protein NDU88_002529 [Pleurodeles waltl]
MNGNIPGAGVHCGRELRELHVPPGLSDAARGFEGRPARFIKVLDSGEIGQSPRGSAARQLEWVAGSGLAESCGWGMVRPGNGDRPGGGPLERRCPTGGEEEWDGHDGARRGAPASRKERLGTEGKSRACWPHGLTAGRPLTGLIT